jgi:hypothetical protein
LIKSRIASGAAVITFGLAALGGIVVAIASPANAAPAASGTTSDSHTITKPHDEPPLDPHKPGFMPSLPGPMLPFPSYEDSTPASGLTGTPDRAHINRDLQIDQAWGSAQLSGGV